MTTQEQRFDTLNLAVVIAVAGVMLFLGAISIVNRVNFVEESDGVAWVERDGQLVAAEVDPDGTGAEAGLLAGDRLVGIAGVEVGAPSPLDVYESVLFNWEIDDTIEYVVDRRGTSASMLVRIGGRPVENRPYYYLCFVGAAFLVAGLFAMLRGHESGASRRFFWLALAFYAVLVMSFTREGEPFAEIIYWVEMTARAALPGLILYFALTFPQPKPHFREHRTAWLVGCFGPGVLVWMANAVLLLGDQALRLPRPVAYALAQLLTFRLPLIYLGGALGMSVLLFAHTYKVTTSSIERKRLRWLVWGTGLGVFPFVAIYVPLFFLGINRSPLLDLAVLPLLMVPVSFGYAAVGFRLWDVEVILKRALAYAVAALAVLAVYLGAEWSLSELLAEIDPQLVRGGALLATLAVAVFFAPLRDRVQEFLDRIYYRERYRSRRGLVDFGRELNTNLDLAEVVRLLVKRVREMVAVGRVAVMLREEEGTRLRLVPDDGTLSGATYFSQSFSEFLASALVNREFLYVDDMESLFEEFPDDRELLAEEDLAYFLPLVVKGEVLGLLAMGRTISGDYLSSEDLRVLQMLTSHAALAVDNALLYRQAERRAREFERLKNYNENIVESIKVGVMVLDLDGCVRSWNHSLESLHGISRREAEGRRIEELFPATLVSAFEQARHRVEHGGEPLAFAYRVALRTRDGHDRIANLSVAPLLGAEGRYGTVVIVDDVTDQTELESQLRQADKLASIGLLAAGVAHEVNTPLAGVSSYVQMLQRKMPDSDPRFAILEKIEKQTFRASSIVNNLLNFSRQQASDMHAVDINSVVNETLALAEVPLSKRKIHVERDLRDSLPPVWGDSGKLQQVFMNLVLNARDSMPKGGELRISTAQRNGEVVVEVADTGAGIDAEAIHKIYDPFFTTKGTGKGTGLGLSVTYGIVQEHRGTITVRSDPGAGTRFRVVLPLAATGRTRAAG